MKKRIIFWAIPAVLAMVIVAILYQISLEEGNSLSMLMEEEFQEEVGPEPEAEEYFSIEEPIEEEMEITILAPDPPASPLPTKGSSQKEMSSMKKSPQKQSSAKRAKGSKSSMKKSDAMEGGLEKAALVEKSGAPWSIVRAGQSPPAQQWKTILIFNDHKLDYTILPQTAGMWKIVKAGQKLQVELANGMASSKEENQYAVQVLSVERRHFNRAVQLVQDLVNDGYYAYLQRTKEEFQNKHWYRVRIGFFKTEEEARYMGEEVYFRYRDVKDLPDNYWVVLPSSSELDQRLVDVQAQQNQPWMLELPIYNSKTKAVADLPGLIEIADFTYLAYRQRGEKIQYRTRLGFFATQDNAKNHLNQLKKIRPALANAKMMKL